MQIAFFPFSLLLSNTCQGRVPNQTTQPVLWGTEPLSKKLQRSERDMRMCAIALGSETREPCGVCSAPSNTAHQALTSATSLGLVSPYQQTARLIEPGVLTTWSFCIVHPAHGRDVSAVARARNPSHAFVARVDRIAGQTQKRHLPMLHLSMLASMTHLWATISGIS
jgi:hypothetical protein